MFVRRICGRKTGEHEDGRGEGKRRRKEGWREELEVDECLLDRPIDETDDAAEDAKCNGAAGIALLGLGLLGDAEGLANHIDQGHDQGAETDAAEGIRQGATGGAPRHPGRHPTSLTGTEEPGAVHARHDGMDGVFQPLGDPVSGKGDEDHQTDDFGGGAAAATTTTRRVAVASWIRAPA